MAKPRKARKRNKVQRVRLVALLVVLLSLLVGVFSVYLLRLDAQIRDRFAGARWALPAQVYAAPMELYAGLALDEQSLLRELGRLGYREDPRINAPGTYMPGRGRLDVYLRPFDFWDGAQSAVRISVRFDDGVIASLRSLDEGADPAILRVDPMLIGSIYPRQGEDRVLVRLDEVPPLLVQGLVAVEDRHFYDHYGVSVRGILRASMANLRAGRVVQGGSTITQQLIKNFFLTSRQTWSRKINEAFMALLIERHYSKDEILEAYLNEVHLGQDGGRAVHGFGLGAQFYFNKPIAELQPAEIALMVGLVKGPSYYNPRRNPERAKARRDLVLQVFHENRLIDDAAYQMALVAPVGTDGGGIAGAEHFPAFIDLVKRQLRGQYKDEDLTNEGLRIFTTLDPRVQAALERRLVETLPELEQRRSMSADSLEGAGVVLSADGGEVLGLVGGRDVRYAGFNRALDTQRPIGSLVKPFVYLSALNMPTRYNLITELPDEPIDLALPNGQIWSPGNYDKQLHGPQPLFLALAKSMNLPTVRLGLDVGLDAVMDTLRAAGYSGNVQPLPSMLLGAVAITPLEVAQMYATLAAGGFQAPASAIREVQTQDGEPLSRYPIRVQQTLNERAVFLTTWAMQQVIQQGTGRGVYAALPAQTEVAGKTGTTDDYRDSWFAGFGGDRVGVIWVGRDDNQPTGLSGSSGALPIWARVMADLNISSFAPYAPAGIETLPVDPASWRRADDGCSALVTVPFDATALPEDWAPCASPLSRPLDWLRRIFK